MSDDALHAARDVLDHEIVDVDGVPCGMVDDAEIDGDSSGSLRIVALLTGPGVIAASLPRPLAALVRFMFGARRTRIAWSDVGSVTTRIELRVNAASLGLNASERRIGRVLARIPLA